MSCIYKLIIMLLTILGSNQNTDKNTDKCINELVKTRNCEAAPNPKACEEYYKIMYQLIALQDCQEDPDYAEKYKKLLK